MYSFSIKTDAKYVADAVRQYGRQAEYAARVAMTKTAVKVKDAINAEMQRTFDRPTPFTMRALYVQAATKTNPEARVLYRFTAVKGTPAEKYIAPNVYGTERRTKRFEKRIDAQVLHGNYYLAPGPSEQLDQYGNMSRGRITQILSRLSAFTETGQNIGGRTVSKLRKQGLLVGRGFGADERTGRKSSRRTLNTDMFVSYDKAGRPRGIYQLVARGKVVRVMNVLRRVPRYSQRFNFDRVGSDAARKHFRPEFDRALANALKTAYGGR